MPRPVHVRFLARKSVYFWLSTPIWVLVAALGVGLAVDSGSMWWLALASTIAIAVAIHVVLLVRSGISIDPSGRVRIVDGFRTTRLSQAELERFEVIRDLSPAMALTMLIWVGSVPDRLAWVGRDGRSRPLQWSFAGFDAVRLAKRRLNRALGVTAPERVHRRPSLSD